MLAGLVDEQNDATLAEYAERLAVRTGVRRSLAAVCRVLKALGLVRKKASAGSLALKHHLRRPRSWSRFWPAQLGGE